MPHRLRALTTQEIPAWSANLSANAPMAWRDDLAREAKRLGIGLGELLRRLLLAGAAVQLPSLAQKMLAAHREYYPKRSLRIATMSAALLVLFVAGAAMNGHDNLRHARGVRAVRGRAEFQFES